ncbi:MAG: FlgO family outer membrane protein [Cyclobacteriaceae bacterium]|jgi:TolB-like protein|nr:FlgO family outer membrane protein [Cyclobacteriaceae bacterium]
MKAAVVVLTLFPLWVCAQKARSYSTVTEELSQKVVATPVETKPYRLAVVPFKPTRFSTETSTQFGDYLTETVIGSLDGHPNQIKLFERTRLDAILKEQEFSLTDLMKPAAALKLGQLVPIDVLLSGTYTKLKSYIDVSARLIDVASGEIIMSYNGRIRIDKNLAAIFKADAAVATSPATTAAPAPPVQITINNSNTLPDDKRSPTREEQCKRQVAEFRKKLDDLSAAEKIEAVVREAVRTPFDNYCGVLHYDVMSTFSRFKINHPAYHAFLVQTLDTIALPTRDDRAYEIVRFLAADQSVDEKEWKASLHAMERVGNYSLSSYLHTLLVKPLYPDPTVAVKRVDEFMQLALQGKVGLPRPLAFENVFLETMEGLRGHAGLGTHVYRAYAARLQPDARQQAEVYHALDRLYEEEKRPETKTEIIGWIADFFGQQRYEKAHEHLYEFVGQFQLTDYEDRNETIRLHFPERDLPVLVGRCRDLLAEYAVATPYPSQRTDRIYFCVRYGIPIPGVIPTLPEAAAILRGTQVEEQYRVMDLLVRMGDKPRSLEAELIGLFGKRSLEQKEKLGAVQTLAIRVLGNIGTSQRAAIDYMIGTLTQYNPATDASEEALVKIGKPAVPLLVSRLDKTTDQDGGLQYQLVTILGKIGKPAATAAPAIQRVLKINPNKEVVYAAEAALQAIR